MDFLEIFIILWIKFGGLLKFKILKIVMELPPTIYHRHRRFRRDCDKPHRELHCKWKKQQ